MRILAYTISILFIGYLVVRGFNPEKRFERKAKKGNIEAQYKLAHHYNFKHNRSKTDTEKAFFWYEKSANQGHPSSMYWLGVYYSRGAGCDKDTEKGIHWYQKASEKNEPYAIETLARIYRNGRYSLPKDLERSLSLYKKLVQLIENNKTTLSAKKNLYAAAKKAIKSIELEIMTDK